MLTLNGVCKTFNAGTINEKRALVNVDLHLEAGDFVTVIGGNGAGKSTLMNMIAGVYPIDAGTITLDGLNISRLSEPARAKYLGRVFQDPMMGTAATCRSSRTLHGKATRQDAHPCLGRHALRERRVRRAPARTGARARKAPDRKVGLLSGGQRQALTLLMATLTDPKLLLLDEHTAALDPKTQPRCSTSPRRSLASTISPRSW